MLFATPAPTVYEARFIPATLSVYMGELTRRIFGLLRPSLKDVAIAVGVGYDTMKSWSSGRTDPSPENRAALAAFMRKHAAKLERLAEELEG